MRIVYVGALALASIATLFIAGQDSPKEKTATTNRVWRQPKKAPGHFAHFVHRDRMTKMAGVRVANFANLVIAAAPALPIDWAKSFPFRMYGNDQYGDCYMAAICHGDNTYTANVGQESDFDMQTLVKEYLSLSGGDNGLSDGDVIPYWKTHGLPGVPEAKIVDMMYVKITSPTDVQAAMSAFGPVMFTFSVPDAWINNSDTGAVWDAPARPNPNNGHAVIFNGTDINGRYKLQTWGTYVWITPAGVGSCDPDGWVAFSTRWFNAKGYAPNGKHITELAVTWTQAGGKAIPANVISSFPPPGDVPPDPPPGPGPIPGGNSRVVLSGKDLPGTYQLIGPGLEVVPLGTRAKIIELQKLVGGLAP